MWILLGVTMIFTGLNTILIGAALFRIGAIETFMKVVTEVLYGSLEEQVIKSEVNHPAGRQLPDDHLPGA